MRLYLVRHGKAERDSPTGRDEDRPLRPRGIRQAQWLGEALGAQGAKHRPAIILSSPLVRALDTARILHQALRVPLETSNALATSADEHAVLRLVQERQTVPTLVLVGHNPTLEHAAAMLLQANSGPAPVLRTGEALAIDFKKNSALLGDGRLAASLRFDDDED